MHASVLWLRQFMMFARATSDLQGIANTLFWNLQDHFVKQNDGDLFGQSYRHVFKMALNFYAKVTAKVHFRFKYN